MGQEKHYQVVAYENDKIVRNCGHKHRTLSGAYECMRRLKDYRNGNARLWVFAEIREVDNE